jgi:hypothetical protein
MTRPNTLSALSCLSLLSMAANSHAQEEWTKHFRIGMSFGMNIKADFKTSGRFPVSGNAPGEAIPGRNHTYDDGFVRLDDTGNAVPFDSTTGNGVTANWGYQNASQYDAAAETLTFHGTSSYSAVNFSSRNDAPQLGMDLAYGGSFRKWERLALGWEFGFNWTPFDSKDRSPLQTAINGVEDVYPTGGTGKTDPNTPFPPAGYRGNFDSAGRPVIDDAPSRTEVSLPGSIAGSRGLEASLYQFRLGPLIRWEFVPRWTLNGSAGGAFGLIDADYVFNERITTATSSTISKGKFGDLETTYGGYAGVVVMYDTGHYWEAYLGAHLLSMSDATVASPGRSARLDLGSAIYLTAGINWTF